MEISLSLQPDADVPRLTVGDNGQGVWPEKMPEILHPVCRREQNRSSYGHGLALVDAFARLRRISSATRR